MNWIIGIEGLAGAFPDGCAVTLGVFDGVHHGHRALLQMTGDWATAQGVPAVALSFHPHPAAILAPDRAPPMICTLAHRVERLQRLGADCVVVQPFTRAFAQLSAEEFIERILTNALNARAVIVGDDFRFGRGRTGDVDALQRAGAFEVLTVSGVLDESGERISSTRIRERIQAGQVEEASTLLGEPWHWTGVATRGDQRGRALGYPTANLVPIEPLMTPLEGVYACRAYLQTHCAPADQARHKQDITYYPAAVSVGAPPMFENARGRVEAYLIDFPDRDLYGRMLTLQFLKRLRSQQKFESINALLEQMAQDVLATRRIVQEVETVR